MPASRTRPPPATRRQGAQAVLGLATRSRILEAALRSICEVGYYGTTTLRVQELAKVSRGSLLNQFPTKADLMVAVSDYIIMARDQAYKEAMDAARDDRHRWELLIDVQWAELCKPGGLARLEIMVAAVSDPELMARFGPKNLEMDQGFRKQVRGLAERLGARDRQAIDLAITTYAAALRGLALDLSYPRPGVDLPAALAAIRQGHMRTLDELVAAGAGESRGAMSA